MYSCSRFQKLFGKTSETLVAKRQHGAAALFKSIPMHVHLIILVEWLINCV